MPQQTNPEYVTKAKHYASSFLNHLLDKHGPNSAKLVSEVSTLVQNDDLKHILQTLLHSQTATTHDTNLLLLSMTDFWEDHEQYLNHRQQKNNETREQAILRLCKITDDMITSVLELEPELKNQCESLRETMCIKYASIITQQTGEIRQPLQPGLQPYRRSPDTAVVPIPTFAQLPSSSCQSPLRAPITPEHSINQK